MAYPATNIQVSDVARKIHSNILNLKIMLVESLAKNAAGDFNALVTLPAYNNRAKTYLNSVLGQGNDVAIKAEIDVFLATSVSIADIQSFITAIDDLSTTVVNNSDLLVMTFNAITLQPEYITPISATPLAALQAKINAALALLG